MGRTSAARDPQAAGEPKTRAAGELTGAEAITAVLAERGVRTVFAYPGTSELALCDSIERAPGIRLVNGRGDKESAFMAAGATLLRPNAAVAVLHGARGLTNAAGAVAAARRNEAGTVFITGLPSTGSSRFLPPHGEHGLIPAIGTFTDWWWEAPAVPEDDADRLRAAHAFVAALRSALDGAARIAAGPSLFGVPQDVAETRWIPADALRAAPRDPGPDEEVPTGTLDAATALDAASRPLFLVDDHALRYPGLRGALADLTDLLGAPVLQLRYRRGPMLFERLRGDEVGNFLGWYEQFTPAHRELLAACDVLVTVEDRNIYPRVVGELPPCRKIAVNGDAAKVRKNGYLGPGDLLVEGDVTETLRNLFIELKHRARVDRPWFRTADSASTAVGTTASVTPPAPAAGDPVEHLRTALVGALATALEGWPEPVLVDDSQMFGGLLSERYDLLPSGLRVFGDHSGFVGGGLATATGLAIGDPSRRVLCTLGDQGFVNAFQALVAAVQEQARLVVLVCNNGESVSLNKQVAADGAGKRRYLRNVEGLSYSAVAEAIGVPSRRVECGLDGIEEGAKRLSAAFAEVHDAPGPRLIELVLPADAAVWRGIWLTRAFDQEDPG